MTHRDIIRKAQEMRRQRRKYKELDEEDPLEHEHGKDYDELEPGEAGDGRIVRKRISDDNDIEW